MRHRREIDGLRSLAVLPVILFHAGVPGFAGGFIGVDVFFVISGYLIGRILIEESAGGALSLGRFYERRARRILPALLAMLLATAPVSFALMHPDQFRLYLGSALATLGFGSNLFFWRTIDYWTADADQQPLLHTWSLAVEEQYYLLFPLAIWALAGRRPGWILPGMAAAALLSLGLAEWASRHAPSANFHLPVTRVWELLFGAVAAGLDLRRGAEGPARRGDGPLAALGLAAVVGSLVLIDERTPVPSLLAVPCVLGTALVLRHGRAGTLTARLLSLPPLVWVGLISYSAYLWHQPILAFARLIEGGEPPLSVMLALSVLSLGVAWASWRLVEQPFRRPGPRASRGWRAAGRAAAALALCAAVFGGVWASGAQERWRMASLDADQRQVLAMLEEIRRTPDRERTEDGPCRFRAQRLDAGLEARFDACARRHGPALLVLGDSHGIDFYEAVIDTLQRPFVVGLVQGGCRPGPAAAGPGCEPERLRRFVAERAEAIEATLYLQAGFVLFRDAGGGGGEAPRRQFALRSLRPYEVHLGRVEAVLDHLQSLGPAGRVIWVGPWLEPHLPLVDLLRADCRAPRLRLRPGLEENFRRLDATLARMARTQGVAYVSSQRLIGFDPARDVFDCGAVYWSDADHLSPEGEAWFGARLAPLLACFAGGPDPRCDLARIGLAEEG